MTNVQRAAQMVEKWLGVFGFADYDCTIRALPEEVAPECWARSLWDHTDEFVIIEFHQGTKFTRNQLETVVLHELAHGICSLVTHFGEPGEELACNRIAKMLLRNRAVMVNYTHALDPLPTWTAYLRSEFKEWLDPVVDSLPERERLVVEGLYYERASLREVARRLNTTHWSVMRLRTKALNHIRTQLETLNEVL